jgi:hypothetical protein
VVFALLIVVFVLRPADCWVSPGRSRATCNHAISDRKRGAAP